MTDLPHLPLLRAVREVPRRKRPGFGQVPPRDFKSHGRKLEEQVNAVSRAWRRVAPIGVDPALILRVTTTSEISEDAWEAAGFTVLAKDKEKTLILFATDSELTAFRQRLDSYRRGPENEKDPPPYRSFIASIESIGRIAPRDRIGPSLRKDGIIDPSGFRAEKPYTLDLELWPTGNSAESDKRFDQITRFLDSTGGSVKDSYRTPAIQLGRIVARGQTLRSLLELDIVSRVDNPPRVSFRSAERVQVTLEDLGQIAAPPGDAPALCVIDSGVTAGHPLLAPAVGEATGYNPIGTAIDENGHGTMVSGLALYGDVSGCIDRRSFVPRIRLFSARVLDGNAEGSAEHLLEKQISDAIRYFHSTYGCRVFNISIGSSDDVYSDGRVSAWAAILDSIARELNIVIVVSVGNYRHEPTHSGDDGEHVTGYPRYLLNPPARVIEPATGSTVLTVGSLSLSSALDGFSERPTHRRPIGSQHQPSPFTRSGPGVEGAIKPELVEYGGGLALDGSRGRLVASLESSVISLRREYVVGLFDADVGTSFSAPKVAHAAAKLVGRFPGKSANLIRALLATSATIPPEARDLLDPISDDACIRLCGYGVPSLKKALDSSENRVVMYAEGELHADSIHVYEVPVPSQMHQTAGLREVTVTLAYDPPVRHTRLDYKGLTLNYWLLRGMTLSEIYDRFRAGTPGEDLPGQPHGSNVCPLSPKLRTRGSGTLQRSSYSMSRLGVDYGDTFHLVVRCENNWAPPEVYPQRYAVVVMLEHSEQVDIYATVRARLRARARVPA